MTKWGWKGPKIYVLIIQRQKLGFSKGNMTSKRKAPEDQKGKMQEPRTRWDSQAQMLVLR